MKLIDIVEELVSEGHKIKFRHRSDGGIIITSIDGKKFTSLTEGNRTARSMVIGGELSFARAEQVKYNVQKYIKLKPYEHKAKGKVDEALDKELKKVQSLWRKNKIQGSKISKKRLRQYIKLVGKKGAMEYLQGREKYARGIAYDMNVDYIIQRLERMSVEPRYRKYMREIEALIEDIKQLKMSGSFREEWIELIYKVLGTSEGKSITTEMIPQVIRDIRTIIGITE